MAISDYNKQKKLDVDSVSGTPTVDKATPIIIGSGDDSTTGNGDIIIDWTNVSSESGIAVYDQNDNLLGYEIEEFDATNETAVLWCYNSWVRDGSTQAKVVYGDGPSSSEEGSASDVWGNTGQNVLGVYHDPSTGTDSSPNSNDGTVTGVTQVNGDIGNAGSYDGTDDSVDLGTIGDYDANFTWVAYYKTSTLSGGSNSEIQALFMARDDNFDGPIIYVDAEGGSYVEGSVTFNQSDGNNFVETFDGSKDWTDDSYHQVAGVWDESAAEVNLYGDGSFLSSDSNTSIGTTTTSNTNLGHDSPTADREFAGVYDEARIYTDNKSSDWIQADYDASPKAGQVFFSQQAAETTLSFNGATTTANASGTGGTTSLSGTTTADAATANASAKIATITEGFESGSLSSEWSGDTDKLTVESTEPINGTYSVRYAVNDNSGSYNIERDLETRSVDVKMKTRAKDVDGVVASVAYRSSRAYIYNSNNQFIGYIAVTSSSQSDAAVLWVTDETQKEPFINTGDSNVYELSSGYTDDTAVTLEINRVDDNTAELFVDSTSQGTFNVDNMYDKTSKIKLETYGYRSSI